MLHVRFDGRSYDFNERDLPGAAVGNDRALLDRLARLLEVNRDRFKHYVVDRRPNGTVIVRPEAVYG